MQAWLVVMSFVYWFDNLSTPILLVWPGQYDDKIFVWTCLCDIAWIINIIVNFIQIKQDFDSVDPLEIALRYIRGLFLIDFMATFPPMIWRHIPNISLLRALHVFYIDVIMVPFKWVMVRLFPVSPHKRFIFSLFFGYIIYFVLVVHYFACFWIYIGDKKMLDDR